MTTPTIRDRVHEILREQIKQGMAGPYRPVPYVGGANIGGTAANKKAAKKNPWIKFLKAYRKAHPTIPHNELFERASREYHKRK